MVEGPKDRGGKSGSGMGLEAAVEIDEATCDGGKGIGAGRSSIGIQNGVPRVTSK